MRESGINALDDDDPTASLPAVLATSYRALTAEQREVFGLLGIAPGPDIGLPAAASLTGLPTAHAQRVLRALQEASLLHVDPRGRHSMHDLIRSYAVTTAARDLPDDLRAAALRQVVDFYLHTASTADGLLDPHRTPIRLDLPAAARLHPLPDAPAALAWLDTEHACLLAAQHTATAHHRHQTVWQLAWTLATFHYRRGHRRDALAVWRAAVAAADHLPDPTIRTLAHRRLGRACVRLGRHEEALGHLHKALATADQHHDSVQQARTHHALARAWEGLGDDRQALEHARHALDLYHLLDQPVWKARALDYVGWLAAQLGEYDTARTHCHEALALHRRHQDPEGEAVSQDGLGFIDHHTGRHRQAVHHYRQALALFHILGDTANAADTLDRLGHPHAALDQREQAHGVWWQALELYRQQGRDADAERVRRQLDGLSPGKEA